MEVRISYVVEVGCEGKDLRFFLPTAVAPRCVFVLAHECLCLCACAPGPIRCEVDVAFCPSPGRCLACSLPSLSSCCRYGDSATGSAPHPAPAPAPAYGTWLVVPSCGAWGVVLIHAEHALLTHSYHLAPFVLYIHCLTLLAAPSLSIDPFALLAHAAPPSHKRSAVHPNVRCDGCGVAPLPGVRYRYCSELARGHCWGACNPDGFSARAREHTHMLTRTLSPTPVSRHVAFFVLDRIP